MLAVSLSYFCYGYVAYIFFTWFFIYLNTVRRLDLKSSSFYGMLPFIAMATCSPLGGWISDRLTKRYGKRVGRCGVAGGSIALAACLLALATHGRGCAARDRRAGGRRRSALSFGKFVLVGHGGPGRRLGGQVSGVMNMCNQSAGAFTASLTPLIAAHFGWTGVFHDGRRPLRHRRARLAVVDPERDLARRLDMTWKNTTNPRTVSEALQRSDRGHAR